MKYTSFFQLNQNKSAGLEEGDWTNGC